MDEYARPDISRPRPIPGVEPDDPLIEGSRDHPWHGGVPKRMRTRLRAAPEVDRASARWVRKTAEQGPGEHAGVGEPHCARRSLARVVPERDPVQTCCVHITRYGLKPVGCGQGEPHGEGNVSS